MRNQGARGRAPKQGKHNANRPNWLSKNGPTGVFFAFHLDFKAKVVTCINRRLGCRGNGSN